jgi:hypothetical protein
VEGPLLVDRCVMGGAGTDIFEDRPEVGVVLSVDDALEGVGLRKILLILRPGDPGLDIIGVFAVGVVGESAE